MKRLQDPSNPFKSALGGRAAPLENAQGQNGAPERDGAALGYDLPNTHGWVNEITGGAVPEWEAAAAPVTGRVKVTAIARNFTVNGVTKATYPLTTTLEATSLAGGPYYRYDYSAMEGIPVGVSAAYFNATNPRHWEGNYAIDQEEIDLNLPRPGDVLNLTGGQSAARGWDAMNAQVQTVVMDIQMGRTSITFGKPKHLGVQDLIAATRARQGLQESRFGQERAGSGTSGRTLGVRSMANTTNVPPIEGSAGGVNLVVSQLPGGGVTISSGLVNGIPVRLDNIAGTPITNESPPTWTFSDGVLYLGLKWTLNFTRQSLTTASNLIPFVGGAAGTPAEDESAGEYVLLLARIVGGQIVDNFSPRKNLWCKVEDRGSADGRAVITIV